MYTRTIDWQESKNWLYVKKWKDNLFKKLFRYKNNSYSHVGVKEISVDVLHIIRSIQNWCINDTKCIKNNFKK